LSCASPARAEAFYHWDGPASHLFDNSCNAWRTTNYTVPQLISRAVDVADLLAIFQMIMTAFVEMQRRLTRRAWLL
jgi:hypothetical protein